MKEPKRFFRYCNNCGKRFTPFGKRQMLCEECKEKINKEANERKRKKQ